MTAKIARLNEGKRSPSTNAPIASMFDQVGDDPEDREPLGDVPLMQALGLTAIPFPPDDTGWAEGVIVENVGGLKAVCIGGWDTRTFSIAGNASPGDTILHSTGPSKAAQVQLKEGKKQAVLVTKGPDGKQMMVLVDGKNGKIQVTAFGNLIEVSKNGINLSCGANGITIDDDKLQLRGNVIMGGMVPPPGMCLATAPVATWAAIGGLVGQPITPLMGVKGAP